MRAVTLLGKLLIVSSILFQAFLLYHDKHQTDQFNKNLNSTIAQCSSLAPAKQPLHQYLRLATSALLSTSLFILFTRTSLPKLSTLLGLLALLWVQHHGLCSQFSNFTYSVKLLSNLSLWHSLGVIGAVVYLLGAECEKSIDEEVGPCESQAKAPESSSEVTHAQLKGRPKRN